jgi:hypothetical protein
VDTARTVLVPAELFEPGLEENYLRFNGMALASGEVAVASRVRGAAGREAGGAEAGGSGKAVASAPENNIVAVMAASAEVWSEIGDGYERGDIEVTSPLLALIARSGRRSKREVNVLLTDHNVYITVWDKGLRMAEALPDASVDSLLYYMQVLGRRFELRRFEIFVGGEGALGAQGAQAEVGSSQKAREVANALRGYFGKVKVVE